MATLASDSFDRDDNADIGGDWVETSGSWSIVSNKLKLVTHNAADDVVLWVRALGATTAADYDVEAICQFNGGGGGGVGTAGRATDVNNMYFIQLDATYNQFRLYKKISGSYTQLGSSYDVAFNEATDYTIKLTMSGTSLAAWLDGTQRVTATDSALTAAGRPGFRGFSTNNGQLYNNFAVYGTAAPLANKQYNYSNAVKGVASY